MTFRLLLLGAALSALLSGAAQARPARIVQAADGAVQVKLDYRDLDLGSASGAQVMLTRIRQAAHIACGPAPEIAMLGRIQGWRACLEATEAASVKRLGAARVLAAYNAAGGTDLMARR